MAIKKSRTPAISDSPRASTHLFDPASLGAVHNGVTRIAVVVHVVWNTAAQNISDAQIASQIDVLNRDYRCNNPEFGAMPAPFLPLRADLRIEFFLATLDPDDAPSNGILRRQTHVSMFTRDDAVKSHANGGANAWPAERYLNIWLCKLGGGLLGYAQGPGGPAHTDGVVILPSAFGTIGTAVPPLHLGRTASHEIGRWLNLNELWGGASALEFPPMADERRAVQFFV